MQRNEKLKKKTIEKLRMILDNPLNEDLHVRDEKYLFELREKLKKPSKEDNVYFHGVIEHEDDYLKPKVKIHKKEEENLSIPEFRQVDAENKIEEELKEDPFEDESLFEIEKLEESTPEFLEVVDDDSSIKEDSVKIDIEKDKDIETFKSIGEEIPEWKPVDTKDIRFKEVKDDESDSESELPGWEPIINNKTKDDEEGLQKEVELNEETSELKEDRRIDVFNDIKHIDNRIAVLLFDNGITSIDLLRDTSIKELSKIKGIKKRLAKKIKNEVGEITVKFDNIGDKEIVYSELSNGDINESEDFDKKDLSHKDRLSDQKLNDVKVFKFGEYFLYKKEIRLGSGKLRTIRFFSKTEPDEGEPVDLPENYEVLVNKKTGVPYIKRKN